MTAGQDAGTLRLAAIAGLAYLEGGRPVPGVG